MQVLYTGLVEEPTLEARWRERGLTVGFMLSQMIVEAIASKLDPDLRAEAVVCVAYPDFVSFQDSEGRALSHSFSSAIQLAMRIRDLPPECAMSDGRKWGSIPVLIIPGAEADVSGLNEKLPQRIQFLRWSGDPANAAEEIETVIAEYRRRLLDELDDLGFLVTYQDGRFVVGPALAPRARLEGEFYFGASDTRLLGQKCYTVDRDIYGAQREVEEFEALINSPDTAELEVQSFFEEHPHFLVDAGFAEAIPHVRLVDEYGQLLIPDFILRPVVAAQRDSKWEVLDLKGPQARLLVGPARRRRLSQEVMAAIRQLRDYGDYFANPRNSETVAGVLNHPLRHPRLGVLIGRLPKGDEIEALELELSRSPGVRLVTYDEVLEQQRRRL